MHHALIKISLIISMSGILFLLIFSNSVQPEEISSYSQLNLGKYVKTQGRIVSVKNYDEFSILTLENNLTITCTCNFRQNQTIIVEGKVAEYKGELQIQSSRIQKIEK